MGRNVRGLALTDKERAEIAYEWTISDYMEDEERRLSKLYSQGLICRDEYLDSLDRLRETAEEQYKSDLFEPDETYGIEESDWDSFEEYMEAF